MSPFVKESGRLLLVLLVCILVGALLLTIVYCIPSRFLTGNMEASAWVLLDEGLYPWLYPWCTSMVDNFTDTFMLRHASYRNDESPLLQAMNVCRPMGEDLYMPYRDLEDEYIHGKTLANEGTYVRYWHGYLVWLSPLLTVLDYGQIRILNAILQTGAFLCLVWLLWKRKQKACIAPLVLMLLFLQPVVQARCLQYSSCHYLMLLGSIALTASGEKMEQRENCIFLLLGIATAYFDYLTYPITTVGVPLCLYYCLRRHKGFLDDLGKGVKLCFLWGFGYGGMWAGKWVLASLITGQNQILGGLAKVAERTNGAEIAGMAEPVENPLLMSIQENEKYFFDTPATYVLLALLAALLALTVFRLLHRKLTPASLIKAAPFAVLAALPYVWYAATANHSIMHAWYTCKSLSLTALALPCMLLKVLEKPKA